MLNGASFSNNVLSPKSKRKQAPPAPLNAYGASSSDEGEEFLPKAQQPLQHEHPLRKLDQHRGPRNSPITSSSSKSRRPSHPLSNQPSLGNMSSTAASPISLNSAANLSATGYQPSHSRHLVTVIPPPHLPHDPPHPRTSSFCTGYSTPENFRRGVLVPLYPTLSGQIAAIAREYGLPSISGIVLYLLETSSELISSGINEAFVGGPRIGEEAWSLLWARLFEMEAAELELLEDREALDLTDGEEDYSSSKIAPPVPRIPARIFRGQAQNRSISVEEELGQTFSDHSSRASDQLEEFSDLPDGNIISANTSYSQPIPSRRKGASVKSPPLTSSRPPSVNSRRQERTYSTISGISSRNYSHSRSQSAYRPGTSHSIRSRPSVAAAYTSSVIVGKVEFDIDRRRGGSRWFDAWIESAVQPSPIPSQAQARQKPDGSFRETPNMSENQDWQSFPAVGSEKPYIRRSSIPILASSVNSSTSFTSYSSPVKRGELFLPNLLGSRTPSSSNVAALEITEEHEESRRLEEPSKHTDIAEAENAEAEDDAELKESLLSGQSQGDYAALKEEDESSTSEYEEEFPAPAPAPAPAPRDDISEKSSNAPSEGPSTVRIPNSSNFDTMAKEDPVLDIFGPDHLPWASHPARDLEEVTGLGIVNSGSALSRTDLSIIGDKDEDLTPQDDLQDVVDLFKQHHNADSLLSSPIHLDSPTFAAPRPEVEQKSQSVESTPPRAVNTPIIVRESPSIAASSRATSMISRSPDSLIFADERQIIAEEDPYDPRSVDIDSTAQIPPSQASLKSVGSPSRASLDMLEDLDNLEKALAELSPRAPSRQRTGKTSLNSSPAPNISLSGSLTKPLSIPLRQSSSRNFAKPSSLQSSPSHQYATFSPVSGSPATPRDNVAPRSASLQRSPKPQTLSELATDLPPKLEDDASSLSYLNSPPNSDSVKSPDQELARFSIPQVSSSGPSPREEPTMAIPTPESETTAQNTNAQSLRIMRPWTNSVNHNKTSSSSSSSVMSVESESTKTGGLLRFFGRKSSATAESGQMSPTSQIAPLDQFEQPNKPFSAAEMGSTSPARTSSGKASLQPNENEHALLSPSFDAPPSPALSNTSSSSIASRRRGMTLASPVSSLIGPSAALPSLPNSTGTASVYPLSPSKAAQNYFDDDSNSDPLANLDSSRTEDDDSILR